LSLDDEGGTFDLLLVELLGRLCEAGDGLERRKADAKGALMRKDDWVRMRYFNLRLEDEYYYTFYNLSDNR
jgi:hypothetical protein